MALRDVLLSPTADLGTDMIVAGAYHHSHLREELFGGVTRDLLDRLKAQGTPIGLVSNSPLSFVERSLAIVGFEATFDTIVSGHEVPHPKPAPDPYLEACRRIGVEPTPSVIALEDSPTGVAAARAAGLTVIGVPSVEGVELAEAHHIAATLVDANVVELTGV